MHAVVASSLLPVSTVSSVVSTLGLNARSVAVILDNLVEFGILKAHRLDYRVKAYTLATIPPDIVTRVLGPVTAAKVLRY